MNDYNNLDFLRERQLSFVPLHFSRTKLNESDVYSGLERIVSWIRSKLNGRFSIVKTPMINNKDRLESEVIIAFEDPKELTFFMLGCPYLRRN